MPLPPPPALGLSSTGNPISLDGRRQVVVGEAGAVRPGTTGTPAGRTVCLARILSPIASIAAAGGPMNTMPASSQAAAKAAFSLRKP